MKCPCCSQLDYEQCCEPFLKGKKKPSTPSELMRSRYTAFNIKDANYLYNTSSDDLKKQLTKEGLLESANAFQFVKLEVIDADNDWVEFKAAILAGNTLSPLHEKSTFVTTLNGEWRYDCGEIYPVGDVIIKRNDPCPCGSGKKFKKCHMG